MFKLHLFQSLGRDSVCSSFDSDHVDKGAH